MGEKKRRRVQGEQEMEVKVAEEESQLCQIIQKMVEKVGRVTKDQSGMVLWRPESDAKSASQHRSREEEEAGSG